MTFDEMFLHKHGPETPPPKPITLTWDEFKKCCRSYWAAGHVEGQANVGRIIEDTVERTIERMGRPFVISYPEINGDDLDNLRAAMEHRRGDMVRMPAGFECRTFTEIAPDAVIVEGKQ